MGVFETIRKSRARTKAEIKAAQAKAKADSKQRAKLEHKRAKLLANQEANLLKAEKKGLKARRKHEKKMAKNYLNQMKQGKVNKDAVTRWAGAARLLIPLLIPLVYRGATELRSRLLSVKANRAGITTEQLARFSGHGAPLKARVESTRASLNNSTLPTGFAQDVEERLDDLDAAIDNAEYMAPQQRIRAHQSISRDLNQVADQIQDKLLNKN